MTDQSNDLPLVYGVWIEGEGWLRDPHKNIFADMRKPLAEHAAKMYRGDAFVILIDESMINLEPLFLEREKAAWKKYNRSMAEQNRKAEDAKLINRLKRWVHGILGHRSNK